MAFRQIAVQDVPDRGCTVGEIMRDIKNAIVIHGYRYREVFQPLQVHGQALEHEIHGRGQPVLPDEGRVFPEIAVHKFHFVPGTRFQ